MSFRLWCWAQKSTSATEQTLVTQQELDETPNPHLLSANCLSLLRIQSVWQERICYVWGSCNRNIKSNGEIGRNNKKIFVVVLKVFCLLFLKCKSMLWLSSSAVRNHLLWRVEKLPSVVHLCHDLPSFITISLSSWPQETSEATYSVCSKMFVCCLISTNICFVSALLFWEVV